MREQVNGFLNRGTGHIWQHSLAKSGAERVFGDLCVAIGGPNERRLSSDGTITELFGKSLWHGHLLPFKHEDVRLMLADGSYGSTQRLEVGGKLDLLGLSDFAADLVGDFQSTLVHAVG